MDAYTYLLINIFTILFPLLRSFENRIRFASRWKFLFPALAITGAVFIFWDVLFTKWNVWEFNPLYITGINLINLPVEEWLFFLTVPFSCVFIYESVRYFIKKDLLAPYHRAISFIFLAVLSVVLVFNLDKIYTVVSFSLGITLLILHLFVLKPNYMGRFYLAYFISFIPFFLVNGILTSWPVVMYNNLENLGIRLYTIPVEDTIYNLSLLLMNIAIYEYLMQRSTKTTTNAPSALVSNKPKFELENAGSELA